MQKKKFMIYRRDCEQYKQAKLFVELDSSLIWCKEKAKEAKDIIATMK